MKKVLLTGASGFIGRQCLAPLTEAGYEVHAVTSGPVPEGATQSTVQWHRADLLDAQAVPELMTRVRPTDLLHLAWYTVPGEYWTSPENYRWMHATLDLVRQFERCGGERVVVAGSCAEYDLRYDLCSEEFTPLAPSSPYATCKHELHLMLDEMARRNGLKLTWGRVFFLYGPHEYPKRLVASVIRSLLRGEEALCSHGRQMRDYMHVADAGRAFAALLESGLRGAVNVASGKAVTIEEIVRTIAAKLGRVDLLRLGALSADEPRAIVADTRRLKDEVGWSPQYDLERGLEDTIDWWREYSSVSSKNEAHEISH